MGKIRSAIVTTIVVVAIVAAAFFAVVSFPYRGGTYRWNSILSVIPLGSEFSGDAECVIYPEGIITEAEYLLYSEPPDKSDYDSNDEEKYTDAVENVQDFVDRYETELGYGLRIDSDEYDVDEKNIDETLAEIKENVKSDAETISKRLGKMNFSSYSVSVVNEYGLKISVPTGYTYSDMRHEDYLNEESSSATKLSQLSSVVSAIVLDGELTICVSDSNYGFEPADSDLEYYPITRKTDSMSDYIKSVRTYSRGGSDALRFKLTTDGRKLMADSTNELLDSDDPTLYFCIGSDVLMSLSIDSMIDSKKFYITISDELGAKSYAAVLDSVVNGEVVNYSYSSEDPNSESISLTANTMQSGQYAALAMALVALVVLIVLCAISVAIYKKLGWLNVAMLLLFSLLMIYVVYLLKIEITIASMLCGMLCLGVFAGTNFLVFENVRGCVNEGNVMQNAVKNGYKKNRAGILDAHIILFVIAFVLYLVGKGALSASGLILTFGFVISYLMYWFTRFMWYCCSSPQKDKFKYCGFKRRVVDDED
ncbi:MAG: hypothetical protein LUD47_01830 [Clostridia bacterium]|nr:hypothetical protein [Clostridia bacterium]